MFRKESQKTLGSHGKDAKQTHILVAKNSHKKLNAVSPKGKLKQILGGNAGGTVQSTAGSGSRHSDHSLTDSEDDDDEDDEDDDGYDEENEDLHTEGSIASDQLSAASAAEPTEVRKRKNLSKRLKAAKIFLSPLSAQNNNNSGGGSSSKQRYREDGGSVRGAKPSPLSSRTDVSTRGGGQPISRNNSAGNLLDSHRHHVHDTPPSAGGAAAALTHSRSRTDMSAAAAPTVESRTTEMKVQSLEKEIRRTLKEIQKNTEKKENLEKNSKLYNKEPPTEILASYQARHTELELALRGYYEKLAVYKPDHPLLAHQRQSSSAHNSLQRPMMGGAFGGSDSRLNLTSSAAVLPNTLSSANLLRDRDADGEARSRRSTASYEAKAADGADDIEHHEQADLEARVNDQLAPIRETLRTLQHHEIPALEKTLRELRDNLEKTRKNNESMTTAYSNKVTDFELELREARSYTEGVLMQQDKDFVNLDDRTNHRLTDMENQFSDQIENLRKRLESLESQPQVHNRSLIDELDDADTMTLFKRIFHIILYFFINLVIIIANLVKVFSILPLLRGGMVAAVVLSLIALAYVLYTGDLSIFGEDAVSKFASTHSQPVNS